MKLDSEELVIDEVESLHEAALEEDKTDSDHGYEGASGSAGHAFDPMLSSLHNCLEEVEDTQNRQSFFEGGAILNIPMCYLEGEVIFPGQTLYLKVTVPKLLAAIERAVNQDDASNILGVVYVYRDSCHGEMRFATTGTTAEILKLWQLKDGSWSVLIRGQQRFRPRGRWNTLEGASNGEIQIIHEDVPLRTPRDAVGKHAPLRSSYYLTDLQNKRKALDILSDDSDALPDDSFTSEFSATRRRWNESALASSSSSGSKQTDELPGVVRRKSPISSLYQVSSAFLPSWAYCMYDSYCLAEKVAGLWEKIVMEPSMNCLLKKPDILSFHIASIIPVSVSTRQELLDIDGISHRLRREIELLESFDCLRCKTCQCLPHTGRLAVVAKKSDMFAMSSDGPLGVYLDSCGYDHEIVTLLKVNGLRFVGHPSEDSSCFPGYAWTIASCTYCECHIGLYFTATKKSLNLQSFWGIDISQIVDGTC